MMATVYQLLIVVPAVVLLKFLFSISLSSFPAKGVSWSEATTKWHHESVRLEDKEIHRLATSTPQHYESFNRTLDAILKPRVPGTPSHDEVQKFISSTMKALDWVVEEDSFTDRTPHGKKHFTNVIATLNPNACRRLVLACHYDSLYNREYTFYGATDSAVPCAMMIHAALSLREQLNEQKDKNNELSLQYLFFDGEEAFKRWSRTDSLYGSRHLASKWNRMQPFPSGLNDGKHCTGRDYSSYLDRMDAMILLDLIGTANPKFYSYFPDTNGLYSRLVDIEKRLNSMHLLQTQPPESQTSYFDSRMTFAHVEDDHVPFMQKGVAIVHLIPSPFPHVWHRESDNRQSLHHPTIDNLNRIFRVFLAEYLHLHLR